MTNQRTLDGRQVLVAGATGRIGRALAGAFAARGADLIVHTGTREGEARELAEGLAAEHGVDALPVTANVLDPAAMAALCEKVQHHGSGMLDVAVNCMATFNGRPASPLDLDVEEFRSLVDVDLIGSFAFAKATIPLLMKAEHPALIFLASLAGIRGRPGAVHLCAAKAGVIGLTRSLAMDLYQSGIRVNAIAPGRVQVTDSNEASAPPSAPVADVGISRPEDVANVALFLASDLSGSVNGQVICVNGGRV